MKTGKTLVELAQEIQRRADAKKDYVIPTTAVSVTDDLKLNFNSEFETGINTTGHQQIAGETEIPQKYYDRCREHAPSLLASNINTWFQKFPATRLFRTLDGDLRALLSDKYRPLENEDLAQAVLPAIQDLGLDIMSAEITNRRLYIKAVDPRVTRELKAKGGTFGDGGHNIVRVLAPAITISNSEIGNGALSILGGVYDGFCSNLATFGERSLRKYHVGGKHEIAGENVYALLSNETRAITDKATWAQVGDVVRAAFDRAKFDVICDKIKDTQDQKIEATAITQTVKLTAVKFGFNQAEQNGVLAHLIDGGDLSRFGLYNAVTRLSQDVADYDRATELERQGAQIIELAPTEWKSIINGARELAEAA